MNETSENIEVIKLPTGGKVGRMGNRNAVLSYDDVGAILGINREIVRQIELRAFKKIRDRLRCECPDDFPRGEED
jgi:DNA-directed RNA polymerase sigma subunit (sigma70/sigma32)